MPPSRNRHRTPTQRRQSNGRRTTTVRHNPRPRPNNAIYDPVIAADYSSLVQILRIKLRQERDKYLSAKEENNQVEMRHRKAEFRKLIKTQWPHYNENNDRLDPPFSVYANPYPNDGALNKTHTKDRWRILATALLAKRGVDGDKARFEGLLTKMKGALSLEKFKTLVKSYLNPDNPNLGSSEVVIRTPPPPYIRAEAAAAAAVLPAYSLNAEDNPPDYPSDEYVLEETGGGRKTRRRKRKNQQKKSRKH
jgi:hypothetical protein